MSYKLGSFRDRFRKWRKLAKHQPAPRINFDAQAFLVEEKFDTWLDLKPLIEFQNFCKTENQWNKLTFKRVNHIVGAESISMLRHLGIKPYHLSHMRISSLIPAMIVRKSLLCRKVHCHVSRIDFGNFIKLVQKASLLSLSFQISHLTSHMSQKLQAIVSPSFQVWEEKLLHIPDIVTIVLAICEDIYDIIDAYKRLFEKTAKMSINKRSLLRLKTVQVQKTIEALNVRITLTPDLIIFKIDNVSYLADQHLFLETMNKIIELSCELLYAHFVTDVSKPHNYFVHTIEFLMHVLNKVLSFQSRTQHGTSIERENMGYKYLKVMEGLGVAALIKRSDVHYRWFNDDLAKNLWKTVYDEHLDCCNDYEHSDLFKFFDRCTCVEIASFIGLVKLCGHPSIEVEKGLKKLYDRTHENITIDEKAVTSSICILKRDLFYNYFTKFKRYPKHVNEKPDDCPDLTKLLRLSLSPIEGLGLILWKRIPRGKWENITLIKNEEFDPVDNQLPLLKDKALGIVRSKVLKMIVETGYVSPNIGKEKESYVGSFETRRALLSFLLSPCFGNEFQRYLDSFMHEDPWKNSVLDYLVIKLTAKELEEKPEGRYFGASPLEERNRRVVQEYNTKKFMASYVPEQLMTPNELQMIRKLYSFRHLKAVYPHHTVLQVSFDFSKWNNSMRRQSIDRPAKEILDKWFGVNLFGRTMEAFENMLVYYKDKRWAEYWDGQYGGIEGLNQDTWTYIFIGGIKQALESVGVVYQLTVKGDDVRAAIVVQNNNLSQEQIERYRDGILDGLKTLCAAMGWSLNPHECFVSLGVICTSKQYQFRDTWLPADDKKMTKCESLSNLVFPTLEDLVSNIFSTAHSACSQATVVLPAYVTATFLACRLIARSFSNVRITADETALLCLWPQVIGGPGGLPLQTFIVRGENDMLAVSISLMRFVYVSCPEEMKMTVASILDVNLSADPNLKQILSDPYSIPLDIPDRPQLVLKRIIKNDLKHWVKNKEILVLLSLKCNSDKEEVARSLLSMEPFYPKIACAIWECTPFTIVDEVVDKFIQSSTIFIFLCKGKGNSVNRYRGLRKLARVTKAAMDRLDFWTKLIKSKYHLKSTILNVNKELWETYNQTCTTEIVHLIRERAWGRKCLGITYPSLIDQNMIYHPEDLTTEHFTDTTSYITSQVRICYKDAEFQTDDYSHHYASVPRNVPWLGSHTSTKLEFPEFDRHIKSPVISKILRLLSLYRSGIILGPHLKEMIKSILQGLTSVNPDALNILIPEAGGGHVCHRVEINSFSMATMPNYRPNISQIIKINNESLVILQSDSRNRTINFAARHFYLVVMSTFPLQSSLLLPQGYPQVLEVIFHKDLKNNATYELCPYCCNIVEDEFINFSYIHNVNMARYSMLSLIGTSQYEEAVLRRNMHDAARDKARRLLDEAYLDKDNPVHQDAAYSTILRKFAQSQTLIYKHAKAAEFAFIPQGELLNILGVNMGAQGLSSSNISMAVIRAIPGKQLYIAVMTEVLHEFLKSNVWECDDLHIIKLSYMQSHLNPLAAFFSALANAGRLQAIAIGCREAGWLSQPLVWSAGSANKGHVAYMAFLSAHIELFLSWFTENHLPPEIKFFTNQQDNEQIVAELEDLHHSRSRLLIIKLFGIYRKFSSYRRIFNMFKARCPHIKKTSELYGVDEGEFMHLMKKDMRDFLLASQRNLHQHHESHVGLLMELTIMFFFLRIINKGDLEDPEVVSKISQWSIICILGLYEDLVPAFLNEVQPNTQETQVYKTFVNSLQSQHAQLLWRWIRWLSNDREWEEECLQRAMEIETVLRNWINSFGYINISVMSKETALNLIETHSAQVRRFDILSLEPIVEEDTVDILVREPDLVFTCHMQHAVNINDVPTAGLEKSRDDSDPLTNWLLNLATRAKQYNQALAFQKVTWFNSTHMYQVTHTINKAVAAWMEIFDEAGIDDFLNVIDGKSKCICIGDGTGAISDVICRLNKNIEVIYCSLQNQGSDTRGQDDSSVTNGPCELLRGDMEDHIARRIRWRGTYPGDITLREVREMVSRMTGDISNVIVPLILSDVELPSWSDVYSVYDYIISLLHMLYRHTDNFTMVIVKISLLNEMHILRTIYLFRMLFHHMHISISKLSNPFGKHAFILLGKPNFDNISLSQAEIFLRDGQGYIPNFLAIASLEAMIIHAFMIQCQAENIGIIRPPNPLQHFQRFIEWNLPIPHLGHTLSKLGLYKSLPPTHWCALFETVMAALIEHQMNLLELEETLQPRRDSDQSLSSGRRRTRMVFRPIQLADKSTIAEAVSSTKQRILDIIRNIVFRQCITGKNGVCPHLNYTGVCVITRKSHEEIIQFIEEHPHLGTIQYSEVGVRINTITGEIDIAKEISKAVKIMTRLFGEWLLVGHWAKRQQDGVEPFLKMWWSLIYWDHCCELNSARYDAHMAEQDSEIATLALNVVGRNRSLLVIDTVYLIDELAEIINDFIFDLEGIPLVKLRKI